MCKEIMSFIKFQGTYILFNYKQEKIYNYVFDGLVKLIKQNNQ